MLGFSPLASGAFADTGNTVSPLFFRAADISSLSTVASEYVVVNMSNRDRSLTILVDEQNRSLLIPSSRP